ncbi:TetR/AcrR family transcriptional regulator [Swingsia samuiensis]|uniref:TetR/AcrR family transcriptional regulator n=1 Tax=Swingsia samuiensis TaxID=1293412 RepID=A0A4Y6UJW1_9PROT|nr:TetR/AcrR family transcriptional regulator [Swingsia samuiensis]QDH16681.1 TetR/AcrR family transcriptional regulator [Swingsia samuiensis]
MGRKGRDPNELKLLITDAAESIITEQGLKACTARAITSRAKCALGSLSYLFNGLEAVILAVNARTLQEMGAYMFKQAESIHHKTTQNRLEALALAYFRYARDHLNRWDALFALRLEAHEELPPDYLSLRDNLITRITTLFSSDLKTTLPPDEAAILARTMYEAVHGIVILGLDRRLGGSHDDVEYRIKTLIQRIV